MLTNIQLFLAASPLGGALKAASGAVLVWLLDNVASLNLPVVAQVAIIAAIPVFINYLNPADTRYGSSGE